MEKSGRGVISKNVVGGHQSGRWVIESGRGGSKFGKMVGGGQNKNSKGQKFEKKVVGGV